MRILFIGNSYTARHDVPRLVETLAYPEVTRTALVFAGGASLRRHWNGGRAAAAIAGDDWDYVVLQEQSTLPVKNRARFHDNVRLFDSAIRDAGAKTALYLTWARANALHTQDAIDSAVRDIAREIGATIVPVGVAWRAITERHPEIALYLPDGSHPTAAGAYLSALVFVATLTGRDPQGLGVPDALAIEAHTADVLRAAAACAVSR